MEIRSQTVDQIATVIDGMDINQTEDIGCAYIHIGEHPDLGKIIAISSFEKSALIMLS